MIDPQVTTDNRHQFHAQVERLGAARIRFSDDDQAVAVSERKGSESDRVDHAECGGPRAEAERQGKNGGNAEAGASAEPAGGLSEFDQHDPLITAVPATSARPVLTFPSELRTVLAMRTLWSPVVLLVWLSGCGEDRSPSSATSVRRDSAGIAIVTSAAPRSPGLYRVDSTPALDLGGTGDPADEFSGTVIALELRDGRIAVANQGTSEIRFYDAMGKPLQSVGRRGSGPGEFERITSLAAGAGDSLLVFDRGTRRLSVLAPTGEIVRSGMIELGQGKLANAVLGVLPGGRTVVSPARSGREPTTSGLVRDSADLKIVGADGSVTEVGRFPGTEKVLQVETQGGKVVSVNIAALPFGRSSWFGISDTLVGVAPTDRYEFDLYSASGRLVRRIRRDHQPEPVTAADLAADLEMAGLPNEDARARYRSFLKMAPIPKTKPAYDRVVPGANGELWFRDYLGPYQRTRPGRWTIFDREGAWLTTVNLPAGFEPTWIGPTQILGSWLDPDDAPHILRFRLLR